MQMPFADFKKNQGGVKVLEINTVEGRPERKGRGEDFRRGGAKKLSGDFTTQKNEDLTKFKNESVPLFSQTTANLQRRQEREKKKKLDLQVKVNAGKKPK